jgi:adenosylcobinamide-phosphate synthase
MTMMPEALILTTISLSVGALALLLERLFGYSKGLQALIGHPVEWMGVGIGWLDQLLNQGKHLKLRGLIAMFALLAATSALTLPVAFFLRGFDYGWIGEALLASTLMSQKSLHDHVRAVKDGLNLSLDAGRDAVSHIVGRDPDTLDESGVTKAALESLAENMSDGVIAPLFWLLIAGLPGVALYKAINTADSMIGYRSDKYRDFGWAAARVDDFVNLVPARITGMLIALAAGPSSGMSGNRALRAIARYARGHVSPNAGWPEAALAGALGIALGGPRSYQGREIDLAWMGDGRTELTPNDIEIGLSLYRTGLNITVVIVVIAAVMTWLV